MAIVITIVYQFTVSDINTDRRWHIKLTCNILFIFLLLVCRLASGVSDVYTTPQLSVVSSAHALLGMPVVGWVELANFRFEC